MMSDVERGIVALLAPFAAACLVISAICMFVGDACGVAYLVLAVLAAVAIYNIQEVREKGHRRVPALPFRDARSVRPDHRPEPRILIPRPRHSVTLPPPTTTQSHICQYHDHPPPFATRL